MARIATITSGPASGQGGTNRHLKYLKQALEKCGHYIECYDSTHADLRRPWSLADKLGFRPIANGRILAGKVLRSMPAYDLVIANGSLAAFLPKSVKVLNILHSCDAAFADLARPGLSLAEYLRRRLVWSFFEAISCRRHFTVAVSNSVSEQTQAYYGKRPEVVIPNCVDTDLFRPAVDKCALRESFGLQNLGQVVLFAGAWEYRKGVDLLNAVAQRLPPGSTLVAAAPTAEKGIPVDPRIVRLPNVPADRMPDLYQAADIFLLPTRAEGFEYVTLEALAAQLPVVVTAAGVGAHLLSVPLIRDFVTPPDADSLSSKVNLLLGDTSLRSRLAAVSRQTAVEHFSIEKFERAYSTVVTQLLSSRSPTS